LDLARAINQAITLGAHIINVSGGQFTPDGEPEALLAAAVDACVENNVLLIAAAGNEGCECLHVPAAAPAALSVGAMDARGQPLEFSNWGAAYRHHGILAPGQAVIGARAGGGTINKSGTSFATPIVSGVAALLLSAQLARGMRPDPARVHAALLSTATPCDANAISDCRRFLAGAVNPGAALEALLKGELTMSVISTVPANAVAAAAENSAETTPAPVLTSLAAASVLAAEAAPAAAPQELGAAASTVTASDCGCGGGEKCSCGGGGSCTCGNGKGSSLVYALGRLGYDFGTEARRDRFIQFMDSPEPNTPPNPYDPAQMDAYLSANLYEADALIWTLNLDATPIYAIAGGGTFGHLVYDELRKCLSGQLRQGVEIVSIPGGVAGTVRLFSGQVVPLVVPALRGVFAWAKAPLVKSLLGARPSAKKDQEETTNAYRVSITFSAGFTTTSAILGSHRKSALSISQRRTLFRSHES
jgi:cyanobactin maturation PatA/PatG family protease